MEIDFCFTAHSRKAIIRESFDAAISSEWCYQRILRGGDYPRIVRRGDYFGRGDHQGIVRSGDSFWRDGYRELFGDAVSRPMRLSGNCWRDF